MAAVPVNVFGDAVTDETVRKYFPDKKIITRKDRAYLAYNLKEAGNKHEKAEEFLVKQLDRYGDDGSAVTLGIIYNATGDTLIYFKDHDWYGHVKGDPPQYPLQIQNGQWAAFLHVGSHATVLYRGHNNEGEEVAWLHAWYNKTDDPARRYVFTEIQKPQHYDPGDIWKYVAPSIKTENYNNTGIGCYTSASMSQDYPYKYSAIMTLVFTP